MRLLTITFLIATIGYSNAQNFSERAKAICGVIQANHIEPKPFDQEFSQFVFEHTIQNLDPNHQVLLAPDIRDLAEKHQNPFTTLSNLHANHQTNPNRLI